MRNFCPKCKNGLTTMDEYVNMCDINAQPDFVEIDLAVQKHFHPPVVMPAYSGTATAECQNCHVSWKISLKPCFMDPRDQVFGPTGYEITGEII